MVEWAAVVVVDRVAARQAALVDQVAVRAALDRVAAGQPAGHRVVAGRAGAVAEEVGAWAVAGMATSSTPVRS